MVHLGSYGEPLCGEAQSTFQRDAFPLCHINSQPLFPFDCEGGIDNATISAVSKYIMYEGIGQEEKLIWLLRPP